MSELLDETTREASSDVISAVVRLQDSVETIMQTCQSEVKQCVDNWLRSEYDLIEVGLQAVRSQSEQHWQHFSVQAAPKIMDEGDKLFSVVTNGMPHSMGTECASTMPHSMGTENTSTALTKQVSKRVRESIFRDNTMCQALKERRKKKKVFTNGGAGNVFAMRQSMWERRSVLERITQSRYYEWVSGGLIIANSVFIGWQTQFLATRARDNADRHLPLQSDVPTVFPVLQFVFCFFFTIELGLRWACEGLVLFFRSQDIWWNLLDVFVVLFGLIDLFTELVFLIAGQVSESTVMGSFTVLRVLRVVRVVRVARVIRVMRFFRELRIMIYSILASLKSLAWVILVLLILLYIFGISFTTATHEYLDTTGSWHSPTAQDLRKYYGTLDSSILSLYMAMSGGNDWGEFYYALELLPTQYRLLFLLFVTFALFAVLNIVTGCFVESAMQSGQADREIVIHEELESKRSYFESMRELFEEMDTDATGVISADEFENKLDDERVTAYFHALKLDVSDARTLFTLLDYDQSDEISIEEFLEGCWKLQGESRTLDMKIMQCEIRYVKEAVLSIQVFLAKFSQFSPKS